MGGQLRTEWVEEIFVNNEIYYSNTKKLLILDF